MTDELFNIEPSKSPELRWLEEAKAHGFSAEVNTETGYRYIRVGMGHRVEDYTEAETLSAFLEAAKGSELDPFPTFDQWRLGKEAK